MHLESWAGVVIALDAHQVLTFVIDHHLVVLVVLDVVRRLKLCLVANRPHPRTSHKPSMGQITINPCPFLALHTTGLGSCRFGITACWRTFHDKITPEWYLFLLLEENEVVLLDQAVKIWRCHSILRVGKLLVIGGRGCKLLISLLVMLILLKLLINRVLPLVLMRHKRSWVNLTTHFV